MNDTAEKLWNELYLDKTTVKSKLAPSDSKNQHQPLSL